jgi:hypothetical protein
MVESHENLVLMQLRATRADISELQGSLGEIKRALRARGLRARR